MGKFQEKIRLPKLTQKDIEKLSRTVARKD